MHNNVYFTLNDDFLISYSCVCPSVHACVCVVLCVRACVRVVFHTAHVLLYNSIHDVCMLLLLATV